MSRAHIHIVSPSVIHKDRPPRSPRLCPEDKALEALKGIFELFDVDEDGYISFLDLKNTLIALSEYESDHGIEEMMRKIFAVDVSTKSQSAVSNETTNNSSGEPPMRTSVEANADMRSQLIDFDRFAQTFLYFRIHEDQVEEDEEVLRVLTKSPTSVSMSHTQQFSSPNRVFVPISGSSILQASLLNRRSKPKERRSQVAASLARRNRFESLSMAYELSELIKDQQQVEESDDDEDDISQEEQFVEHITLNEFENRQVFRVIDIDGNGSITIGELKDLIIRYCPSEVADELDEDRLIDMLSVVDINSDGQVQYEEFLRLIELYERDKRECGKKRTEVQPVAEETDTEHESDDVEE